MPNNKIKMTATKQPTQYDYYLFNTVFLSCVHKMNNEGKITQAKCPKYFIKK